MELYHPWLEHTNLTTFETQLLNGESSGTGASGDHHFIKHRFSSARSIIAQCPSEDAIRESIVAAARARPRPSAACSPRVAWLRDEIQRRPRVRPHFWDQHDRDSLKGVSLVARIEPQYSAAGSLVSRSSFSPLSIILYLNQIKKKPHRFKI